MKNEPCDENRHPTSDDVQVSAGRHPHISIGKSEQKVLMYLKKCEDDKLRFQVTSCADYLNSKRSTVGSILKRLIKKNLVDVPNKTRLQGVYWITKLGKQTILNDEKTDETCRLECRDARRNLSIHKSHYTMAIKDNKDFSPNKLDYLGAKKWKPNPMHNWLQYWIYFDDATITINPRQVIIEVHDVLGNNTHEADLQRFNIALGYAELIINKAKLECDQLHLEHAHYARIESFLFGMLQKVNKTYYLELKDGRKLWIDHSPPNDGEVECNQMDMQQRTDEFMTDLFNSEAKLSDIEGMNQVVYGLIRLEVMKAKNQSCLCQNTNNNERPNYYG